MVRPGAVSTFLAHAVVSRISPSRRTRRIARIVTQKGTGHFPRQKLFRSVTSFDAESDLSPFVLRFLPGLLDTDIECEAAVLIASSAQADPRSYLIFELDDLALGAGGIRCECDEHISGDALLNGHSGSGILPIAAQHRIHGKRRDAGNLFDAARQLAADLSRDGRLGGKIARSRICGLCFA